MSKKMKEYVFQALNTLEGKGYTKIDVEAILREVKRIRVAEALKELESEGKIVQLPNGTWLVAR